MVKLFIFYVEPFFTLLSFKELKAQFKETTLIL